jgi:hypothetical protein
MSAPLKLTVKGKRPAFHDNASVDRLIAMMMAMASEMSALRDRVETLEALGATDGWLKPGAVEGYEPDSAERKQRDSRREAFLGRLFYVLQEELDDLREDETEDRYWSSIGEIAQP